MMIRNRGKFSILPGKDSRVKIMHERINTTEKHFGELCTTIAAYTRKLGRFRDKHDELAKVFQVYSEEEDVNKSLSFCMDSLSKAMTILADSIDLEVHRIELKIISEFSQYGVICRNTREGLRAAVAARNKELHRQKQLIDIKTKFSGNTNAADTELLKAKLEVNRTNKDIDEIIDSFEKTKLKDIKTLLQDFLAIQLKQHTKAIEVLSATYCDVTSLDEKTDFQEFKKLVRLKSKSQKGYNDTRRAQSVDNLSPSSKLLETNKTRKKRLSLSTKDLSKTALNDDDDNHNKENSKFNNDIEQEDDDGIEEDEEEDDDDDDDENDVQNDINNDDEDDKSEEVESEDTGESNERSDDVGDKSSESEDISKADLIANKVVSSKQNADRSKIVRKLNATEIIKQRFQADKSEKFSGSPRGPYIVASKSKESNPAVVIKSINGIPTYRL